MLWLCLCVCVFVCCVLLLQLLAINHVVVASDLDNLFTQLWRRLSAGTGSRGPFSSLAPQRLGPVAEFLCTLLGTYSRLRSPGMVQGCGEGKQRGNVTTTRPRTPGFSCPKCLFPLLLLYPSICLAPNRSMRWLMFVRGIVDVLNPSSVARVWLGPEQQHRLGGCLPQPASRPLEAEVFCRRHQPSPVAWPVGHPRPSRGECLGSSWASRGSCDPDNLWGWCSHLLAC